MTEIGKIMMVMGALIFGAGVCMAYGGKFLGLGKLPGDIIIKKENVTFYFPIVTSIIISIILTLLWQLFTKK